MSAALVLLALSILASPPRSRRGAGRLQMLADAPGAGPTPTSVFAGAVRRAGRWRCILAGGGGVLVTLLGVLPVLPAMAAGVIAGLVIHLLWSAWSARAQDRGAQDGREAAAALAAELRSGQPPERALSAAAAHAPPGVRPLLLEAARTAALGGDVSVVFRAGHGEAFGRIGSGWELSRRGGCSLADVLDAIDRDLVAALAHRRLLAGLLAGPRATAVLLAGLPVLGLLMGSALGARPWHVLTATGPGQLALAAGVALDVAGVVWTDHMLRSAESR